MASERLQIIIDATFKGKGGIEAAGRQLKDLDDKARKASEGTRYLKEQAGKHLAAMGMAFGAVSAAGYATWKMLESGAELELAASRFDNLTKSIGTTADAMMIDLKAATGGMVSNAEAMSSASQIISLGLADNQQDVVDLASLVTQLGWDMQQVIMTFANNSKMRLDALGLSVTDVEERAKKLEAQGYNTDKAFDLAVIQAGQAKLELLGSAADTTAGRMKKFEANVANLKDGLALMVADGLGPSVEAMNTLIEVYGEGESVIEGIVDAQIAEAETVQELIDLYGKLEAQRGIGSLITGTTGDLAAGMVDVKDAIYDASTSADEYAKAVAALGIPGIEANRITEEMTQALYDAAKAEYEAMQRERERLDVIAAGVRWSEANTTANRRMADQYSLTGKSTRDLTASVADMNYHQEEAYEGMISSTAVLEANEEALNLSKAAYDRARDAAARFAEAQDAITRQQTQDFLTAVNDTTSTLTQTMSDYIVAAGGSATETGLWMVATGDLSKEQYNAAMNTLIMQESMKALAEQYAKGEISLSDLQTAMDDLVAGAPYKADADIDTKESEERMRMLQSMLDAFDGRHARATATVENRVEGPPQKGDVNKPDGSTPPGGSTPPPSGPTPPQGPALASGTGGWVTVPPGYPNDTYNARLSSGERFNVIPAGQSGGMGGGGATISISFAGAIFQGTTQQQAAQIAQMTADKLGRLV